MKRCKKCLHEYRGSYCPHCGDTDTAERNKRMKYVAVTLAVVIISGIVMALMKYCI